MKYNDIEIENITKEILPKLSQMIGSDLSLIQDDICFEHSKYCMNKDGEIIAFIILRNHSLYDYFNGEVPLDRNIVKWYSHIRDGISECFSEEDNHFEMIFYYLKDMEHSIHLYNLYAFTHTFENGMPIGAIWTKYQSDLDFPLKNHFYNFNDDIWIDAPFHD